MAKAAPIAVFVLALATVGYAGQNAPLASAPLSPPPKAVRPAPAPALASLPELGIEVVGVHVTAGGSIVDFRYRVVDSSKAARILKRQVKLNLLDEANGLRLNVPVMPYVGALRQSAIEPEAGKTYFILFGNAARSVKPGSKVTLVIGDAKIADLAVT
jgi:hypothetical protein